MLFYDFLYVRLMVEQTRLKFRMQKAINLTSDDFREIKHRKRKMNLRFELCKSVLIETNRGPVVPQILS